MRVPFLRGLVLRGLAACPGSSPVTAVRASPKRVACRRSRVAATRVDRRPRPRPRRRRHGFRGSLPSHRPASPHGGGVRAGNWEQRQRRAHQRRPKHDARPRLRDLSPEQPVPDPKRRPVAPAQGETEFVFLTRRHVRQVHDRCDDRPGHERIVVVERAGPPTAQPALSGVRERRRRRPALPASTLRTGHGSLMLRQGCPGARLAHHPIGTMRGPHASDRMVSLSGCRTTCSGTTRRSIPSRMRRPGVPEEPLLDLAP